tara:strand:+ start:336 stop:512 length:177 start_codon:yes stop_codon:yes gene_type:complete
MQHEALLEMVNVTGQTISEYVRGCIMVSLCGGWDESGSDVELEEIDALVMKNSKRFGQ